MRNVKNRLIKSLCEKVNNITSATNQNKPAHRMIETSSS